nr:MMPL family transporter [Actinoplanes campanulatus]
MRQRFPGMTVDAGEATVVFVAPPGAKITDRPFRAAVDAAVERLAGGAQVAHVDSPFEAGSVSRDATAAYTGVRFESTTRCSWSPGTARNARTGSARSTRWPGPWARPGSPWRSPA